MGCWYSVSGEIKVRDTLESRGLLAELREAVTSEFEVEAEDGEGVFTLSVSGGMMCSYSTASDVDEKLQAFGPYAVEAVAFQSVCDDEKNKVWVGDPEDVKKAKRARLVATAGMLFAKLTPEERAQVIADTAELKK